MGSYALVVPDGPKGRTGTTHSSPSISKIQELPSPRPRRVELETARLCFGSSEVIRKGITMVGLISTIVRRPGAATPQARTSGRSAAARLEQAAGFSMVAFDTDDDLGEQTHSCRQDSETNEASGIAHRMASHDRRVHDGGDLLSAPGHLKAAGSSTKGQGGVGPAAAVSARIGCRLAHFRSNPAFEICPLRRV